MNTKDKTKRGTKMAGYGTRRQNHTLIQPTQEQINWLNRHKKIILDDKWLVDDDCAKYDRYIEKNLLSNAKLGNPHQANRLNELDQADANNLTLANGTGGGFDTEEHWELKCGDYCGINCNTHKLNQHIFWFSGLSKYPTWEKQLDYLKNYFSKIPAMALAIICPDGHNLNFVSRMNQATINILLTNSKMRHRASIKPGAKNPKMRTTINSWELLAINNFKLLKKDRGELAEKYLGGTYDEVI
jgi:hypothetical protein